MGLGMRPVHLLLGHSGDSCCAGVLARLAARGLPTHIVASPLAPPARLAWRLDDDGLTSRLDLGDEPGRDCRRPGARYGLARSRRLGARGSRLHAGGAARRNPRLARRPALPRHQPSRRPHSGTAAAPRSSAWRPLLRRCGLPRPRAARSPTIPPRPAPSAAASRPTASPARSTRP